ncbi:MAG: chromosome segregation protein ScpA [Isosphaera sp.]|nr:chromosome segregation protein ScpA [Isosphaera sp.]
MPFTVALDAFHGPLDLLLHLVRRDEVDVLDLPVARLADQFLDYLRTLRELDVELAGDFLVTAATLVEIKSRLLLPADARPADDGPVDPRRELVRQLLEYRRVKDAAAALEGRAEARGARVSRQESEPTVAAGPVVRPVELWDLVSAFARLVRETQGLRPATVAADDTPQHVHEGRVRERVAAGRVRFVEVFDPPYGKARLIGVFLAVLELVRRGAVGLEQPDPGGDIWLVASEVKDEEHGPGQNHEVGE